MKKLAFLPLLAAFVHAPNADASCLAPPALRIQAVAATPSGFAVAWYESKTPSKLSFRMLDSAGVPAGDASTVAFAAPVNVDAAHDGAPPVSRRISHDGKARLASLEKDTDRSWMLSTGILGGSLQLRPIEATRAAVYDDGKGFVLFTRTGTTDALTTIIDDVDGVRVERPELSRFIDPALTVSAVGSDALYIAGPSAGGLTVAKKTGNAIQFTDLLPPEPGTYVFDAIEQADGTVMFVAAGATHLSIATPTALHDLGAMASRPYAARFAREPDGSLSLFADLDTSPPTRIAIPLEPAGNARGPIESPTSRLESKACNATTCIATTDGDTLFVTAFDATGPKPAATLAEEPPAAPCLDRQTDTPVFNCSMSTGRGGSLPLVAIAILAAALARRSRAALAIGTTGISLAACTLLVDTDDLSGGPDTTPVNDAAPGIDVTTSDGSNTGSNDAGDASSAVLACNAPGLVAYFPFDENQGTTTRDCSGNALVGTFAPDAGPTWTQGIRNSALHFENTFVTLGQPSALDFSGTRALSVAAFIRIGAVVDADRPAIVSRTGQSGKRGWELAISDASENRSGIFRLSPDNQTEVEVYTATPLPLGQWVHLAATYQPSGKMRIYIDGQLSAETAAPASIAVSAVNAVIGGRSYDYFWKGDLDEVRIFDRALADADVAALAAR